MSNQRSGKTYRAAPDGNMDAMKMRVFFRTAAEVLNEDGQGDAAFYFEQLVDHINEGGSLPQSQKDVARVLGL